MFTERILEDEGLKYENKEPLRGRWVPIELPEE